MSLSEHARPVFDADNHYYEPRDAFTRHLDPSFERYAVRPRVDADGVERLYVGSRLHTYMPLEYDEAPPPGALRDILRTVSKGEGFGFPDRVNAPMRDAYIDRTARLQCMDEQGIDACLMFPSLGVTVEHFMRHDPAAVYANFSAFNKWLEEDWGFGDDRRIYGVAVTSLIDVRLAVAELDRLIACGARVIYLRPGPQGTRSPADPVFDPFWARVQDAELLVTCHSSESGYNEMFSTYWGEVANPDVHTQSAFQWTNFFGDRPIMDTLSAMVLHNLFGRFPRLRVVTVENGSFWVPYLLKVMDKMKGMGRSGRWLGGPVEGKPSEIFKEHVWVVPFHEEPVLPLVEAIGPDRVLFGSDFPHPEGLADPTGYRQQLAGLDEATADRIMGGTLRELITH